MVLQALVILPNTCKQQIRLKEEEGGRVMTLMIFHVGLMGQNYLQDLAITAKLKASNVLSSKGMLRKPCPAPAATHCLSHVAWVKTRDFSIPQMLREPSTTAPESPACLADLFQLFEVHCPTMRLPDLKRVIAAQARLVPDFRGRQFESSNNGSTHITNTHTPPMTRKNN